MNNSDTRTLLDDLFADQGADTFRDGAMASMLCAVRRKRRIKRLQVVSALVVMVAAVSLTVLLNRPVPTAQPRIASKPIGYRLVTTTAFAAEHMIQSQAGLCTITRSQSDGFAVIESMDSRQFVRQLDDEGLLGLFAGRAVALVYRGPGEAELVFPGQRSVLDPQVQ